MEFAEALVFSEKHSLQGSHRQTGSLHGQAGQRGR